MYFEMTDVKLLAHYIECLTDMTLTVNTALHWMPNRHDPYY